MAWDGSRLLLWPTSSLRNLRTEEGLRDRRWVLPVALLFGFTTPALGVDTDADGIDDVLEAPPPYDFNEGGTVAIVNTGDGSVNNYASRLGSLGFLVSLIDLNSGYGTLSQYQAIVLPTSHGSSCCNAILTGLASDYIQYVNDGGCLYIGQPNPYNMPQPAAIPWAPHTLNLYSAYDINDCNRYLVDPNHCVTRGEWQVLVRGSVTDNPGVLFAFYGQGHVVVDFGHPSPGASCTFTDAGLDQMMTCCLKGPVSVERHSWGRVKSIYHD
jgi:hypothetical protein